MQDFDRKIRKNLNAHYFARYVDDIILVMPKLDSERILTRKIKEALPKGLRINFMKSKFLCFQGNRVVTPSVEHNFDYLGFEFNVYEVRRVKPFDRSVKLNISASKVKRNKTRIVKSLLQYISDGKFSDLRDRIRVLTCGLQFFDERRQKIRNGGLQHTYCLIPNDAPALIELDKFLKVMILCRSGPIGGRLSLILSNRQRKELLKYSFATGLANRVHFRYSPERLAQLVECWKYV